MDISAHPHKDGQLNTSPMSPAATHLAFMRKVAVTAPIPSFRAKYARQARELAGLIIQAGCHPVGR